MHAKKVTVESDVQVANRDLLYDCIRNIWDRKPDVISGEEVIELFKKLNLLTNVSDQTKKAHVEDIDKKYKNTETPPDTYQEMIKKIMSAYCTDSENDGVPGSEDLICPRCGEKLILRTAKKGPNAGSQFYGCSAFPKCRYIRNI